MDQFGVKLRMLCSELQSRSMVRLSVLQTSSRTGLQLIVQRCPHTCQFNLNRVSTPFLSSPRRLLRCRILTTSSLPFFIIEISSWLPGAKRKALAPAQPPVQKMGTWSVHPDYERLNTLLSTKLL